MVFTNENVELDADDAPIPALKLKQIKEFFRQRAKPRALSPEKLGQLNSILA